MNRTHRPECSLAGTDQRHDFAAPCDTLGAYGPRSPRERAAVEQLAIYAGQHATNALWQAADPRFYYEPEVVEAAMRVEVDAEAPGDVRILARFRAETDGQPAGDTPTASTWTDGLGRPVDGATMRDACGYCGEASAPANGSYHEGCKAGAEAEANAGMPRGADPSVDHYEAQGYELPEGYTREAVAAHRAEWGIDAAYVPIATSRGGPTAWGVPYIDGTPLAMP